MEGSAAQQLINELESLGDGLTGHSLNDQSIATQTIRKATTNLNDLSNIFANSNTDLSNAWSSIKTGIEKICLLLNSNLKNYVRELKLFCEVTSQNDKEIYDIMIKTKGVAEEIINSLGLK